MSQTVDQHIQSLEAGGGGGGGGDAAAEAARKLAEGIKKIGEAVKGAADTLGKVANGDLSGALNAAASTAAQGLSKLGPYGEAAGIALQGIAGAMGAVFDLAKQTVGALNPSAMLVFDQTLRDLTASIGVALEPVIEVASKALQELGSYLLPIAEKLRPVFAKLGEAFMDIAETVLPILASAFDAVIPLLQALADVLKAITGAVKSVFGGLTSPEKKGIGGMAASQNSAFTGFAEFGKQVALAAQKAGGGAIKTDSERLDDIATELKKLNSGETNLPKAIGKEAKKGGKAYEGKPAADPMGDTGGGDW